MRTGHLMQEDSGLLVDPPLGIVSGSERSLLGAQWQGWELGTATLWLSQRGATFLPFSDSR